MITLNSMPSFAGKTTRAIPAPQNQPETPQAQAALNPAALKQDVFFSGHGDQSEKKQTTLVLNKQGLRFEPRKNPDANAFLRKQLDELIARDADLDQPPSRFGKPILHEVASVGDNELVLKALRHGARVRTSDSQNYTALHLAARGGHKQVVETLLDAGANPARVDIYGNTPIHGAKIAGHDEIANLLSRHSLED